MEQFYQINILNDKINSATTIQVMSGVLGGLYWALLPQNQNKGLCFGEDLDYNIIFSITQKFLGKIFSNKTFGKINSSKLIDLITTPSTEVSIFTHI